MPDTPDLVQSRYSPSTNDDTNPVIATEQSRLGSELEETYGFDILANPANADIEYANHSRRVCAFGHLIKTDKFIIFQYCICPWLEWQPRNDLEFHKSPCVLATRSSGTGPAFRPNPYIWLRCRYCENMGTGIALDSEKPWGGFSYAFISSQGRFW